jgi:hypothetical protein
MPLPTHHQKPSHDCQMVSVQHMSGSHQTRSKAISTNEMAVLMMARPTLPAPKAAVPPSVRQARRLLTSRPQMSSADV